MADPNDPYAGLTPEEAQAARGQDISSRSFWNWLRSTMEAPPVVRRPGFQTMAGLGARGADVNVARSQGSRQLFDEAQKRIAENRNRLDMSRNYATDPGSADYAPFVAGIPQDQPATPAPPADVVAGYEGDSPRERIAVTAANDILARQREAADSGLLDRANFQDENAVPNPQRARVAMPLPVRRPAKLDQTAAPQQQGGFFSNLFKDPYAGMSSQQLWSEYNKSQDPAMFVRADKAMMAERAAADKTAAEKAADKESADTGKAKGGAVGGKDVAIHKALEIIHHLLTRGH